jgi:hypothetical protein
MNRRSLFRKLIGAVVGVKAASVASNPHQVIRFSGFDPAFNGGDYYSVMRGFITKDGVSYNKYWGRIESGEFPTSMNNKS